MYKYFEVSLILMQAFALNLNMGESTDINQCPSTGPALWLTESSTGIVNPEEERACDYDDEKNDFSGCKCVPPRLVDWDRDPKYMTDMTPLGVDELTLPWLSNKK